ncbi:PiggyBac transposable element-derived protein 4 [Eumeta japonica]|uniref:PiggyBac transposable element-derived protein 4 n=1 Tax=Eumeta variegata TaxID=151549 RepID=A0A4C1VGM6_EUMVA|nr:PiggyBac transposable element-derived protein 4 [Eumeta japonica]
MDNFYNSSALARYLKCRGFNCLRTVRVTRKNIPEEVKKMKKNCKKSKIIIHHCGEDWCCVEGCIIISTISTFHNNSTYMGKRGGQECEKPICIRDFNSTMRGIDLKDQKLSMYLIKTAVRADASLTQVGERQMSHAAERGGRLCLFVARSALSLALQALNGTPQSEVTPHESCFSCVQPASSNYKTLSRQKY